MNESSHTEAMLAEWSKGMRLLLCVFLFVVFFYFLRVVSVVPSLEKIFEDMLGSSDKLPADTQFVLAYRQIILTVMAALNGLAMVAIFTLRRPFHVCCVAAFVLLIGIFSLHLVTASIFSPLVEVIKGLSGGQ